MAFRLAYVALGLVAALLVVGLVVYAADYPVEATVTEKECGGSPPRVEARTDVGGVAMDFEVSRQACDFLDVGHHVEYRVRSGHVTVYDQDGGRCVYDSQTGAYCGSAPAL